MGTRKHIDPSKREQDENEPERIVRGFIKLSDQLSVFFKMGIAMDVHPMVLKEREHNQHIKDLS